MRNLIETLKEAGQDQEFYPTTNEIIFALAGKLGNPYGKLSLLEVGAGNGKVFKKLEEFNTNLKLNKYAIEQSEILIAQLPSDVVILGTDFWNQSLIDKEVDIIFSNPPYSQFVEWSEKLIREAFAKKIYLVIPSRWQDSLEISEAIKGRNGAALVVGSFDFLNSEDRQARAKVDLVEIILREEGSNYNTKPVDPFDSWFNSEFKIKASSKTTYDFETEKRKELKNQIEVAENLVQTLTTLYEKELGKLLSNYRKLSELDESLLKELGITLDIAKSGLKSKIKGLKNLYWRELFNKLDKITSRLATKQKNILLEKMLSQTSVDFNESNIFAIVVWVMKNANQYYDEQLTELYERMTEEKNVINYKSNKKTLEKDGWRYTKKDFSHYTLDYRIILEYWSCWEGYSERYLGKVPCELIADIVAVANNLGFPTKWDGNKYQTAGTPFNLESNGETLAEIKIFKNNNVHIKFNQSFIKALNIEAARLNKWIRSPEEAAQEFGGSSKVSKNEAEKFFKKNFLHLTNNPQLLLN
jgi:hypothetical protein